jgi:predicted transcriptional regulator
MAETEQPDLTALTVQLLSAYVLNNTVPSEALAGLIETTRSALGGGVTKEVASTPEFVAAVTVRKSLGSRDHLLSMIDGKPYKTLKRHLAGHGLTPEEYRARYNLPRDYPMVAPGYSEHRRDVAKKLGLGRKRGSTDVETPSAETNGGPAPRANEPPEAGEASSGAAPVMASDVAAKRTGRAKATSKGRAKPDAAEAKPMAAPTAEKGGASKAVGSGRARKTTTEAAVAPGKRAKRSKPAAANEKVEAPKPARAVKVASPDGGAARAKRAKKTAPADSAEVSPD